MEPRYERNIGALSLEENEQLSHARACIVGIGGLGGHIANELIRVGISNITIIDDDVFVESNLNRQLYCTEELLGKQKAIEAQKALLKVNSMANINAITERLTEGNAKRLLSGYDLVFDALDNVATRLVLEDALNELNIPYIHGAVSLWNGQVSTVYPGDNTVHKIYEMYVDNKRKGSILSFAPAVVASYQVCEGIKLLLGKGETLQNKVLLIDFLQNTFNILHL